MMIGNDNNSYGLEFSLKSRESMSSGHEEDEEEEILRNRVSCDEEEVDNDNNNDDDDDEFDDVDSGAGSDDFDLLELGETGAEFCRIGDFTCSVPFEIYDLPGLEDILSVEVWNEVLTEGERVELTKYLPDMDQEAFARTLKLILEGGNLHFGSPIKKLFDMLKGGLCEPRVALYRDGLGFFQKRRHYHFLREYVNSMVSDWCQIRDSWMNCKGYSIQEKLRVLNIMKSQKSLMYEKSQKSQEDDLGSERSEEMEVSGDALWLKKAKVRKGALKLRKSPVHSASMDPEFTSQLPSMAVEVGNYGKKNPKGILKFAGPKADSSKEIMGRFNSVYSGLDVNSRQYGMAMPFTQPNKRLVYDLGPPFTLRDQIGIEGFNDAAEDTHYGIGGVERDHNVTRGMMVNKPRSAKSGKRHDIYGNAGTRNANQLSGANVFSAKPSSMQTLYEFAEGFTYPESVQQFAVGDKGKPRKGRFSEPMWHAKNPAQVFSTESSFKTDDWNTRLKKRKAGRDPPEHSFRDYGASSVQWDDRMLLSQLKEKSSREKNRVDFTYDGLDKEAMKRKRMYMRDDETESDSSEQFDDDDDESSNPFLSSKSVYANDITGVSRMSSMKPGPNSKRAYDGGEPGRMPGHLLISKQKGKMHDGSPLYSSGARVLEDGLHYSTGKLNYDDERKWTQKSAKNEQSRVGSGEMLLLSPANLHSDRKKKREAIHNYAAIEEEDTLARLLAKESTVSGGLGKRGQRIEGYSHDQQDRTEASLLGCNSVSTKKRKMRDGALSINEGQGDGPVQPDNHLQVDDSGSSKKKGKRKLEVDHGSTDMGTSEPPLTEIRAVDVELETKPQKKPYTPITPTVHKNFTFSIIHLLTAVRLAMITPLPEDSLKIGESVKEQNKNEEGNTNQVASLSVQEIVSDHSVTQVGVPSLNVHEIVNHVRSSPGDPCILETQEPLQDLVRGVLKIFSSKTAPLGAKGWKALVGYEKSTKSWSWIGPVSNSSKDQETTEEVTSPEYWGLPHKTLVKLVDSFANWLKSGQETLQQIGSLPAPPLALMQCNLDEKERFKDLRAQKSLITICPSTEEVRDYFRKEEVLRYSIPDRAFQYTAADGKKSIVAPLRRCGGKPNSKARDHFMLKRDRPAHVTILCLVRDAAARLPGSIGTRADVCTLIRDSQFIVEDVTDAQVNQVVSGALDRLHYERDPCVQFDGERKLWVYLHRDREEEDFEDDGTSSTKKWKRPKKDTADQSNQGIVTVAFPGDGEPVGFELGDDLNAEPPAADDDKRKDPSGDDLRQNEEHNTSEGDPTPLEGPSSSPLPENKLVCQENSANEVLDDDETYGR